MYFIFLMASSIKEVLEWLDDNQAEKEDYDAKQKELESLANPIISAAYQAAPTEEDGEDDEEDEDEL